MASDLVDGGSSEPPVDEKAVNAILLRRVIGYTRLTIPATPPTMVFLAVLFWSSSSHLGLIAWVVTGTIGSIIMAAGLRASSESTVEQQERRLVNISIGVGVLWGALPIIAMPTTAAWQLLMAMLLVGVVAASVVASGSHRPSFMAFHVTITIMLVLGFAMNADGVARWAALVFTYAGPIGVLLARFGHSADHLAATMTIRNEALVAQLQSANSQLEYRAKTDALTDLANKASFNDFLDAAVSTAMTERRRVAVLFLDLDRFKAINDGLGHAAGDELLRAVARRVASAAPDRALVSRLGGDEIAVCLPDVESSASAVAVGEKIIESFEAPFILDGRSFAISTSIGVALTTREWTQPDDLVRFADMALYRAKARGGSCVEIHDHSMMEIPLNMVEESSLRAALEQREIVPYFQPIVSLVGGETIGFEALIRWVHPHGVSVANAFMPSLVTSGLYPTLTQAIFEQISDARKLYPELLGTLPVSLNIPAPFLSPFASHVAERGGRLDGIMVEVSTHGLPTDAKRVADSLERVRALGARVCLDDVGPGSASLAMLAGLAVDCLKLDRSVVQGLTSDFRDRAIAASVAELARRLGIECVAEGLETAAQVEESIRLGYSAGQGWVFAPAMPVSRLTNRDLTPHQLAAPTITV